MGRFSSWSALPRLLYYTATCSSPFHPSSIASTLHLRHFSAESVERLRHVWISGLIDPDKVGPTERSMLYAGKIDEMHASMNKEQQSFREDSDTLLRARKISEPSASRHKEQLFREDFDTIRAGITFVKWKDHKITIMDTSCRVDDITHEVETALRAFDSGAIHVLSSIENRMGRYNLPRLIFINNIDHKGANPWQVLNQAYYFHGSNGEKVFVEEVPADMEALVAEKRRELIENVAPFDDKLAEAFYMNKPISATELEEAIRRTTLTQRFIPVFMGSAFKYKGLQLLLDGVLSYLQSPILANKYALDQSKNGEKNTLLALAFSLKMKYGKIRYLRIKEGVIQRGHIVITDNETSYEVPELYQRFNDELEMIPEARAGEIVTVYEHCIDDDLYRYHSLVGDTFIDGLEKYAIVGIVRYRNTSPKDNRSYEDIDPKDPKLFKELMSGGIDDIYPSFAPRLEIFHRGKVEDST